VDPLIRVEEGDISTFHGDAVVNAANNHLRMGAGVAGALARVGGPSIQAECDEYVRHHGPLPVGGAAITGAGDLPVRWVIHAAAMGDEPASEASIRSSTRRALALADEHHVRSIAFPVLGSGVAGFPFDAAARAMIEEVRRHATRAERPETLVLYGFGPAQAEALRRVLEG
jgi:O-acetyl-ADP-ribose deacetylase (regulator of RNase III)